MDDERARELMILCGQGDLEAYEQIVQAYRRPVLGIIYRYLGHGAMDAEDLAQDVFLRAWRARERYRPEAKFKTWLFRIVTNRCLNYIRDNKKKRALSLSGGAGGDDEGTGIEVADTSSPTASEGAIGKEVADAIHDAVERLPDSQRLAILLSRFEEMSHAEIAETMGLTEKGVKSLLFRARENLRRILAPQLSRDGDRVE